VAYEPKCEPEPPKYKEGPLIT